MDKSWMHKSRSSPEYLNGVIEFLNFAFDHATNDDRIPCPCIKCCNKYYKNREDVHGDLLWNGIMQRYINWTSHGEDMYGGEYISDESEEGDDMHEMLQDAFGMPNLNGGQDNESPDQSIPDEPNMEAQKFYKLLKDAENELYPGCTKFSKLSFLVRLFHLKCLNGWSNKSFDMLLELLKEALPVGEMLPKNHYESKKILRDLGLHYIKIDACPNDCMLYWKEYENTNECTVCGESRWKSSATKQAVTSSTKDKKIAAKILRYFPLKPRLQRLFMSSKTAEYPVDEKSAEIISKFKELSATQEGGSSGSIGDEIYTQVMGAERHGRVRGYGLGPTPTSVFGSTSRQSQAAFDEVVGELNSVQQKLQQMEEWKRNQEEEKRQIEEWRKNQEEEKRQMEEWRKNQEEELKLKMEEWRKTQDEEKRKHEEEMKLMHAIIAEMRQHLSSQRQNPSKRGANG